MSDVLGLTAQIVSVHIAKNKVAAEILPSLIEAVYRALATAGHVEPPSPPQTPAVPVKKSVFPDYIVCLEDGRKLQMLKRHLRTSYGITPEQYRVKWNLPADYPMIAPNYASHRSTLARSFGLGRKLGRNRAKSVSEPTLKEKPRRQMQGSKG